MKEIKLNPDEAILLQNILDEYLSDLRMEISDTDDKEFREELKIKENSIKKILEMFK
jgi:hypothetical protein